MGLSRHLSWLLPVGVTLVFVLAGGVGVFELSPPEKSCVWCHEIRQSKESWAHSSHRKVSCKECHGGSLESVHATKDNLKRVWRHLFGGASHEKRLNEEQIVRLQKSCATCHSRAYGNWQGSRHSSGYARFFQDEHYNKMPQLNAQCLWCHGMFYDGTMSDLVKEPEPGAAVVFRDPAMASRPAVPCLACHKLHTKGQPYKRSPDIREGPVEEKRSIGFYVRQEKRYIPMGDLKIAEILEGSRKVRTSPDPRQRLCMQCHAPNAHGEAGSASDRTPRGVHEELSCLSCHDAHSGSVDKSCVRCHPRFSTCGGRDVTMMDTTFRSRLSKNNIHRLTCTTCHESKR